MNSSYQRRELYFSYLSFYLWDFSVRTVALIFLGMDSNRVVCFVACNAHLLFLLCLLVGLVVILRLLKARNKLPLLMNADVQICPKEHVLTGTEICFWG